MSKRTSRSSRRPKAAPAEPSTAELESRLLDLARDSAEHTKRLKADPVYRLLDLLEQLDNAARVGQRAGVPPAKISSEARYLEARTQGIAWGLEIPLPSGDAEHDLLTLRQWCQRPSAASLVYLTAEDWDILTVLADAHPRLLTQEEIEGAIPELRVAVRTIQKRLPSLLGKGLVCRPEGDRSGWGPTDAGLQAVRQRK